MTTSTYLGLGRRADPRLLPDLRLAAYLPVRRAATAGALAILLACTGKTTVAAELRRQVPGARLFDPEYVGLVLRRVQAVPTGDFQDLATWSRWVVRVGRLVARPGRPALRAATRLDREPDGGVER